MRGQIAQRACTSSGGKLAPGCRGVRVCAVGAVEFAAEGDEVAQLTGIHQFFCKHIGRAFSVDEVNQTLYACFFDRVHHCLALGQRVGHRLFAQDMLACLSSSDRDFRMGEIGRCDDDQFYFRIADDVMPVDRDFLIAEALRGQLGCRFVDICDMLKYRFHIMIGLTNVV